MLFHNISQYLVVVEVETCAATASQAALITTTPSGGTTTVFTTTGTNIVPGPVVLDGFTFSGTPDVQYGNTNYGLAANGIWARNNVPFSWIAGGGDTGTLTIDLSGSFSAVGLFMNYALWALHLTGVERILLSWLVPIPVQAPSTPDPWESSMPGFKRTRTAWTISSG